MQEPPREIEAVRRDRMDTEDAPPEMQEAKAVAAEFWLELVDDTDLGA